ALKYIHDPGITGLTQARNRAVKENECDYVLFLDDDVILERDFILNILEIHKKYPEIYGLSGIITNLKIGWTETFIRKIFEIGIFADKRIFVYSNPKYHNYEVVEVAFLPGGLTSFKKEVFQDFQFDENFLQYGLSEDVDFSFRVSQRYKIAITPKARLMHICSESGKADDGKFRENLVLSMHYFFRKNLRKNIFNYFCFTWLNVGFIYNAVLMAVFKHDFNVLIGNINGIKKIIKG
ncbi:MAG: glycosyltransferase family 2 protein, partial [Nitrospirae bacterium]|nr:glycosyltransferase family 2 protein [Nitrospirota bacterium]